jgi:hypothetical protein
MAEGGGEDDNEGTEEQSQPLAKARARLEQLESAARGESMRALCLAEHAACTHTVSYILTSLVVIVAGVATVEMTQADYVRRIERLHSELLEMSCAVISVPGQCLDIIGAAPRLTSFVHHILRFGLRYAACA